MLKQLKNYFVLWENSTALQKFEAATKADAMKAARLYRRQWEITDDKPVKALNEAEAAAYEAERNAAAATTNQGKEAAPAIEEAAANVPGEPLTVNERTLQLLKMQANLAAALPGVKSLQIVGRWLWLEFTSKPTAEIREQLKANKWTWAPKKGKWCYHNPEEPRPGKHRFVTLEEIKDKYGHAAII